MSLFNLLMGLFLTINPAKGNIEEYTNKMHPSTNIGAYVEKDKLGVSYDGLIKGFRPFISADIGQGKFKAGMKFGIPCPGGIRGDILANIGSENFSYNNTINNVTNEDGIRTVENIISDQKTSTNSSAFGLGFGKGTTKFEVSLGMNNTDDKTTENSHNKQTYGSSIIDIDTEAKTDLEIGRNDINTRLTFPIYSDPYTDPEFNAFIADVGLYANWSSMGTKGNTTISNQININDDITTNHEIAPINNQTNRIICTIKPKIEKRRGDTYGYAELPTNFGEDHSAVEFNGGFCGYKKNLNLIGYVNSRFDENQASFGGDVFYSGNSDSYNKLVRKIKGGLEGTSSILKTPGEGERRGKTADIKYLKNLEGFSVGTTIELNKGEMPKYGINFGLSKNHKFACIEASTQNLLDMRNYEVSITGGSGIIVEVNYGKVHGDDDFWGVGLTL